MFSENPIIYGKTASKNSEISRIPTYFDQLEQASLFVCIFIFQAILKYVKFRIQFFIICCRIILLQKTSFQN